MITRSHKSAVAAAEAAGYVNFTVVKLATAKYQIVVDQFAGDTTEFDALNGWRLERRHPLSGGTPVASSVMVTEPN